MNDILIYSGIGINIIGALILMAYGMKYAYLFHLAKRMPQRLEDLKAQWSNYRRWGFGLIFIGIFIASIGCVI